MTTKPTKGHWPKGKRRHEDRGDWEVTRLALTALLDEHHEPGAISAAALARDLGVSGAKTVTRWLAGVQRPDPETQGRIAVWVRQRRAEIARRRGK